MDMVVGGVLEHIQPLLNEALALLPGEETTGARVSTLSDAVSDANQLQSEEEADVVSITEGKKASLK
jgi:hypothetical protein